MINVATDAAMGMTGAVLIKVGGKVVKYTVGKLADVADETYTLVKGGLKKGEAPKASTAQAETGSNLKTESGATENASVLDDSAETVVSSSSQDAIGNTGTTQVENVVAKGGKNAGAMARREYQGASYHGKVDNAVKSRAPVNGQDALDVSIQVKGTSPRRVGIDYKTGEFAVFDQTSNGVFHGHVRGWKDLTSQMQNALRNAGMVDRKGNILGGN